MQHHMDRVAMRKAGNIEGWEPWFYQRHDGGLLIKVGPVRTLTRGPRKGQKTADRNISKTVLVSDEDIQSEYQRYEAETGNCGECFGDKQVLFAAGVSGNKYRECRVCSGTGKAINQATKVS